MTLVWFACDGLLDLITSGDGLVPGFVCLELRLVVKLF